MSDIKEDVKVSVKVFTQTAVSSVVKESTKKLIKSLTQSQKSIFEARIKNMSDDQLERYFDNNPYFKNALENTIRSVNDIPSEEVPGSWMEKLQSVYEATYSKNLTKILIRPAPRVILSTIICIALLVITAFSIPDDVVPVANFSSNVTSGYAPLSVQFLDLSGNAKECNWDFGDGATSTQQDPAHIYSAAGIYKVSLTATNGKHTDSKLSTITVLKQDMLVANFSSNVTSGYLPLTLQFKDLSGNTTGWSWDFGDGNLSTEQNPVHTYYTAENYTVNLTASSAYNTDSKSAIIAVLKQPGLPVANFSSSVTSGYAPLSVQFSDLSENAIEWNWDFGDGTTSTQQDPAHVYSFRGSYIINLKAINTNGTDSKLATIEVLKRSVPETVPPVADFGGNVTQGKEPLSVLFTDLSKNAAERSWDFENDGIVDSTDKSVVHVYTVSGIYTVKLTATSEAGTASKLAKITVLPGKYNVPVAANFETNVTSGYVPLTVQFKDLSENASEWNWDFGDGNLSTEQNPMHTYYAAGIYKVSLTAINTNGTDSEFAAITVFEQPLIHFYAYVTNRDSNTVSVINTTTNNVTATVPVGIAPWGIAVDQDRKKVYVANNGSNSVSVIDTAVNNVEATVTVGSNPHRIAVTPDGKKVYVTNWGSDNISVIDTATNKVTDGVTVGDEPVGVAVNPSGTRVYVANARDETISVIDTATNSITATVSVGTAPGGVAVNPSGTGVYVTNWGSNTLSVINTTTNSITATVSVGTAPEEVIVTPDGKKVYVANFGSNAVSVIDTDTNKVTDTVPVGDSPYGIAVSPDGKMIFVTNRHSSTVSIIDTATNKVISTVPVGSNPHGVAVEQRWKQ